VIIERFADIRYVQQSSELTIALPEGEIVKEMIAALNRAFNDEHHKTFGHSFPEAQLELNALRIVARIVVEKPPVIARSGKVASISGTKTRKAYFGKELGFIDVRVLTPDMLGEQAIDGPVFIDTYDTTVVVPPNCDISLSVGGSMLINIK